MIIKRCYIIKNGFVCLPHNSSSQCHNVCFNFFFLSPVSLYQYWDLRRSGGDHEVHLLICLDDKSAEGRPRSITIQFNLCLRYVYDSPGFEGPHFMPMDLFTPICDFQEPTSLPLKAMSSLLGPSFMFHYLLTVGRVFRQLY